MQTMVNERGPDGVTKEDFSTETGLEAAEMNSMLAKSSEAKSALLSGNMRLVFHIARYYKNRGVAYSDLVQEGTIGLVKAIDRFDPARGFRFSTYASWWVKQAVSRAVAEKSRMVRLPVHIHDLLGTLNRVERTFYQDHERLPTSEELSVAMALPVAKVELLQKCSREVKSTEDSVFHGNSIKQTKEVHQGDRLESENLPSIERELDNERLNLKHLVDRRLSGREAAVVQMRYGLLGARPMTLEQVGKKLCVTRERIRQIEAKALSRLKSNHIATEIKEIFHDPGSSTPVNRSFSTNQEMVCTSGPSARRSSPISKSPSGFMSI